MSMAEACALAGQHDSEPRAEHQMGEDGTIGLFV